MASNQPTISLECDQDLWFEDGDTRICARRSDSGALCLYNLYRDLLAAHSPILINILDTCRACCSVYVDGTTYAYLPDDDALDLARFFVAVCYPKYMLFRKHEDARSFRRTLPVIRLALKYEASEVIEALASQLEQDWPLTVAEWDLASRSKDGPFVEPPLGDRAGPVGVTEPASAIQVARIANSPSVLSAAYYQLALVGSTAAGWRKVVSQAGAPEGYKYDQDKRKGRAHEGACGRGDGRPLLSKEDLQSLASGKRRLSRHMGGFTKRLPQELRLHPNCANAWHSRVPTQSEDPLADLLELCRTEAFPDGNTMCPYCRSLVNKRGREERERVWASLPALFCLPVHL